MNDLPIGSVIFENVSKRYRLGSLGTLRGTLTALRTHRKEDRQDLWALKDVSFRLEPGDALGIIGPNGAGKTTALKLLSNVTRPTSGRIRVGGRFSSLIELGAGFHPELTGRENIFLNGAILGQKRSDIRRKLDAIIAFSELERFIDTPVKRYSSGMYVRLGFAVAAHVEPDVLLVDEVLAVGDASFRQKCMTRMEALRSQGTSLIFVSHNMYQVRRLCPRSLLLMQGRTAFYGPTDEAIATYEEGMQAVQQADALPHEPDAASPGVLALSEITLLDERGAAVQRLDFQQPLHVHIRYRASQPILDPIVKVRLLNSDGLVCALVSSTHDGAGRWAFAGKGEVTVRLAPVQLTTGQYFVEVRVADSTDAALLADGQSASFFVRGPAMLHEPDQGVFVPNATWRHKGSA